jgi:hypothetical protein
MGTGTNTLNVTRSLDFPVPAGSTVLTIAGGTGGLSTGWVVTGTGIAPRSTIASIKGLLHRRHNDQVMAHHHSDGAGGSTRT